MLINFFSRSIRFEEPINLTSGTGSTGGEPGNKATDPTSEGGQPAAQSSGDESKTFTQSDLDAIVQKRLAEERARSEKKQTDAKRQAEADALKKKEEWQTLAQQRETELAELKPKADLADVLIERMNTLIESETKDWPEEVKALDPGAEDVAKRMEWLEKSRALAAKLKPTSKPAPQTEAGAGSSTPKPNAPSTNPSDNKPSQPYRFQGPNDVAW